MEELRRQQTEEMREVENYVEHIRSLTNERETLTAEFEAENEALKGEIERLTSEVQGGFLLYNSFDSHMVTIVNFVAFGIKKI